MVQDVLFNVELISKTGPNLAREARTERGESEKSLES